MASIVGRATSMTGSTYGKHCCRSCLRRRGSVARDEQAQEPLTVEEQEEAAQREAAQAEGWAEGYKPLPRGEDQ